MNAMKIILVQPPGTAEPTLPVELARVAPLLSTRGHEVRAYDLLARPDSIPSFEQDVVDADGVYLTTTTVGVTPYPEDRRFLETLARAVKHRSRARVWVGGTHATLFPDWWLESRWVDLVLTGEPETTLPFLADNPATMHGGSWPNGVLYRAGDGTLTSTGDHQPAEVLDALPFPDYTAFDPGFYPGPLFHRTGPSLPLITFPPSVSPVQERPVSSQPKGTNSTTV